MHLTSPVAIAIALALCAVALVPLALAAWRGSMLAAIAAVSTLAIASIAFFSTGLLQRDSLARTDVTSMLAGQALRSRCEETFDLLLEARVIGGRPTSEGLVVNSALWDQLPRELHEPILLCVQDLTNAPSVEAVKVIRR